VNIIAYHQHYFAASAWLVLAVERFKKAKDDAKGMGVAVGTAQQAQECLKKCEPFIGRIPAEYKKNFDDKLKQSQDLYKMAHKKNQEVYFEPVPPLSQIPIPDAKNFVKLDSDLAPKFLEDVEMSNTLRYVIPPAVRKMQAEFRQQVQNQIDQQYKEVDKEETNQRVFMGQYQLPQSYHEVASVQEIPESYASKIMEFQKKGAITNFKNSIEALDQMYKECMATILETKNSVNAE
jgi:hypothetical protein